MKNPWKRYSKINPQRNDGNRQICNTVFHALISASFTGAEYKIILAIIDKTWGFGKNNDSISISQFAEMTNLSERTVQRTLKKLHGLRVVYLTPFGRRVTTGSPLNKYSFNKHYDTWKVEGCQIAQGCQVDHPPKTAKGDIQVLERVTQVTPTKETITKETITKEKELTSFSKNKNEEQSEQDQLENFYPTKRKRKLRGKWLETFLQFWEAFDYKSGKAEAADAWLDILGLKPSMVEQIIIAAKVEAQRRPAIRAKGNTPKMAQGWLSGRRWEDEETSHIDQEQIKPRSVRDIKDLDQIRMAQYLNKKRKKQNEGTDINDGTRSAHGNERQLPEPSSV